MKKRTMLLGVMVISVLLVAAVFGTGMVLAKTAAPKPAVSSSSTTESTTGTSFYEGMQAQCQERLNAAVDAGKITPEQKQAILDKQAEVQKSMGELEKLPSDKRGEGFVKIMSEMQSWAADNGIKLSDIMGHGKGHMSMGDGCSPEMMQGMGSMMNGGESMM